MDVDSTTSNLMEIDTRILSSSAHSSLSNAPYTDDDHRRMDEAVTHKLHLYGLEGRECLSFAEIVVTLQEVILQDNQLDPKIMMPMFQDNSPAL
jgi:hypothetical protein